jgi:hypothetical protein
MHTASMFYGFISLAASSENDSKALEEAISVFGNDVTEVVTLDSVKCSCIPDGDAAIIVGFNDRSILMSMKTGETSRVITTPPPRNEIEMVLNSMLGLVMVAFMNADAKND